MLFDHILSPIRINGLEVKNRVVRAAHGTSYGRGHISDDLIAYHEARARGGVGLNILEATVVHPSTSNHTVNAFDDSIIPGFTALAKACGQHGMRTFVQLWHGGHRWAPTDGRAPISASDVPCPNGQTNTPQPMTLDQIEEIIEAFADAAGRAQAGGLDGVELHCGHGYIFHQFLCSLTNRRDDDYGGSLENRTRFMWEALRAIRSRVGDAFPVGIRISDYGLPGGFTAEDAGEVVARACDDGLIDFVSGSMGSPYSLATTLGCMDQPAGYMLPSVEKIISRSTVPTMVAGRFGTLDEGEQIVRSGVADMVSFVRAMIADPDLIVKSISGNATKVRPCIACNQGCIGGIRTPAQKMTCTVNPTVGFERTLGEDLIKKVEVPRKVVIIGGGPAGMEAARLATLHGHHVVLMEAQASLGGAINIAKHAPKLQAIHDITLWQEEEIYRLGVDIRLSTFAEAADVLAESPDVVIIATGSLPRMDGYQVMRPDYAIPGFDQRHVLSSWNLLIGARADYGSSAVVFDDIGHYEGIAAAEYLIERGVAVTYVARHQTFSPTMDIVLRTGPALRRLRKGQFDLVVSGRLVEIGGSTCRLGYIDGEETWDVPADTVVFVSYNQAQGGIWRELGGGNRAPKPYELHLIGDANAPRDLLMAIREGNLAGRIT